MKGFAVNPKVARVLLATLSIAIGEDWKRLSVLSSLTWLVTGIGIFLTLSRGGVALYVFTLSAYIALSVRPRIKMLLLFDCSQFWRHSLLRPCPLVSVVHFVI